MGGFKWLDDEWAQYVEVGDLFFELTKPDTFEKDGWFLYCTKKETFVRLDMPNMMPPAKQMFLTEGEAKRAAQEFHRNWEELN